MIPELKTILIAMTPLGELRAAIPVAVNVYQMPIWSAYIFSVLGNLIPPIFILWGLKTVSGHLSRKVYFFNRFFAWLFTRTKNNHFDKIEKWKEWGLVILVAIPLPFTGAWTGSLAAFVFNLSFRKSLFLIALGVAIAGIMVIAANFFGVFVVKYLGWQVLLGFLALAGFVWWYFKKTRKSY